MWTGRATCTTAHHATMPPLAEVAEEACACSPGAGDGAGGRLAVDAVQACAQLRHTLPRRSRRHHLHRLGRQVVAKIRCRWREGSREAAKQSTDTLLPMGATRMEASGNCSGRYWSQSVPERYWAVWSGGGAWPSTCSPSEKMRFSTTCIEEEGEGARAVWSERQRTRRGRGSSLGPSAGGQDASRAGKCTVGTA